jgi:dihydrofolate reductase
MSLSLIAAVSKNHCIGKDGELPWHLPEDMKHFKDLTIGKVVLMGRKTWESIPEKFRPLPRRTNVIVTRQMDYAAPEGVEVFHALDEALAAHKNDDVICIGGGELYREVIEKADTLHMTHIDREVYDCDTFFPEIDPAIWRESARDERDGFSFVTYERK